MLKQCSPSVRSKGGPASGRSKTKEIACTGHWLCPVVILEDLDLSGIDWTLGGSVRSLPPERLVSRYRAASGLFPVFCF